MDSHLSLIGSIVIGSLLFLSIMSFEADLKDHSFKHMSDLNTQESVMKVIEILQWDFRQIGYGVSYDALAVYDSNFIAYYADIGNDGVIDTVRYSISDTTEAYWTPNPNDKIFYRWSNSDPQLGDAVGVTDFRLKYFDKEGNQTLDLTRIKTIEITLEFESTHPSANGKYSGFFWREKVTPMNLQPL